MQHKLRDYFFLFTTGTICAALAWLFLRFAGEESFSVLTIVVLVVNLIDNWRLRRRVQQLERQLARYQTKSAEAISEDG